MNLQKKYDLLMEKIADKEVAPGLIMEKGEILIERRYIDINVIQYSIWNTENDTIETTEFIHSFGKIIGHPITIGRCMQYCKDNDINVIGFCINHDGHTSYEPGIIAYRPQNKLDRPIEPTEEFEPVIDYLLNI